MDDRSFEDVLYKKIEKIPAGLRENKNEEVFKIRNYISPEDLSISNYIRRKPLASFNAGALEKDGKVYIFPRLIFDYYNYTSSVGVLSLNVEELISGKWKVPLKTKIILWPQFSWEFLGCEDPRVYAFNDEIYMLYTGKGYRGDGKRRDVLAFAKLNSSFESVKKDFFKIKREDEYFLPNFMKDSAFVKENGGKFTILIRPEFKEVKACWKAEAVLEEMSISYETMEPIMIPEKWEERIGWSTNVVKISQNSYLVGWHAIVKEDLSYRNGIALIDEKGKLLAVSDYLLIPRGINEEYGDRSQVIFGDGLILHDDLLIWIGGMSDYAIGVFVAKVDDVLKKLKFL